MLRLPPAVVRERAGLNEPGVPAAGNPAGRMPGPNSPRTPPADHWRFMRRPSGGIPQSPRAQSLQHLAAKSGAWLECVVIKVSDYPPFTRARGRRRRCLERVA